MLLSLKRRTVEEPHPSYVSLQKRLPISSVKVVIKGKSTKENTRSTGRCCGGSSRVRAKQVTLEALTQSCSLVSFFIELLNRV